MKHLIAVLALAACLTGCAKKSTTAGAPPVPNKAAIVTTLNVVAVAAATDAAFQPKYAPYMTMVAQFATASVAELQTADTTQVQLNKILASAISIANQAPDLASADDTTKMRVLAAENAILAIVGILEANGAVPPAGVAQP